MNIHINIDNRKTAYLEVQPIMNKTMLCINV